MSPPVLEVEQIHRTHGEGSAAVHALKGVSLCVQAGEFLALQGPSGCGKSTLLNILGLADAPTSGTVLMRGERIDFALERDLVRRRRSSIGYVFQQFNLLPTLTAYENVLLSLLLNKTPRPAADSRVLELLARVGLTHRAHQRSTLLSGGEMQRVAVCRAIAHRPPFLLADEPTGNLDTRSGAEVLTLLRECCREGTAIIMATHSDTALEVADRVISMRDGLLV